MVKTISVSLLFLCACSLPPDPPSTTELVTEKDGCKLYKYRDHINYPVYFTTCAGGTSTLQRHGKTTRQVEVPTSEEEKD